MENFSNFPHFYLTQADKGGKLVFWKRDDYSKGALRQLSDTSFYKEKTIEELEESL